jgi:hypothetical protein
MKILRVKKTPLFDVFVDEGWYNWSRVVLSGNSLKVIGGEALTTVTKHAVLVKVLEIVNDK